MYDNGHVLVTSPQHAQGQAQRLALFHTRGLDQHRFVQTSYNKDIHLDNEDRRSLGLLPCSPSVPIPRGHTCERDGSRSIPGSVTNKHLLHKNNCLPVDMNKEQGLADTFKLQLHGGWESLCDSLCHFVSHLNRLHGVLACRQYNKPACLDDYAHVTWATIEIK